jgi:hypothetical protein
MTRRTFPRERLRRPYRPRQRPPTTYALSRLDWQMQGRKRWRQSLLRQANTIYWDHVCGLSPAEAKAVAIWEAARARLLTTPGYDPLWPTPCNPSNLARLVAVCANPEALRRLEAGDLRC